ncbi:hypothetical protein BV20DRAFT_730586 [Pilatotrama ljubarskyi]|nr:hypothetical protein BV20DRAFT_730586 [Pilatotrama ljubarskyi]
MLNVFLSAPTVRVLELHGRFLNGHGHSCVGPDFQPTRLTSLHYIPSYLRPYPRIFPAEINILGILLAHLSCSLRTLVIPSESTPYALLNHYEWPHLRELCIQGDAERVWTSPVPLISALSRMPRLRVLCLKLARTDDPQPLPIWPSDHLTRALPWPELESLTISWPCPGDRIFEHLPHTLRHLSLRCWPRLLTTRDNHHTLSREYIPWLRCAPTTGDILGVLGRCPKGTALQSLDLEYMAAGDTEDAELLRYIPVVFPDLQELQIYRYCRPIGASPATVGELSSTISRLGRLRVLRLYLDFKYRVPGPRIGIRGPVGTSMDARSMQAAADALLRDPRPSFERLYFLSGGNTWAVFHLARSHDGRMEVHIEHQSRLEGDAPYE